MSGGDDAGIASNGDSLAALDRNARSRAMSSGAANGTLKAASRLNGSSNGLRGNGTSVPLTYFGHDREEVTRILMQALSDMGYQDAAESVRNDSGYVLESDAVTRFRSAILEGRWDEAEALLLRATQSEDEGGVAKGLVLAAKANLRDMQFSLRRQKYLEVLDTGEITAAMSILRNELTPLAKDAATLTFLSSLLMCASPEQFRSKASWVPSTSRRELLTDLSRCISPSVMLPEHRLSTLLDHVKTAQIATCLYHSEANSPSLYSDHSCPRHRFPTQVVHELDIPGEVWQVQFANRSRRLAACGSHGKAAIWNEDFSFYRWLDGHSGGVGNLAWSPDDTKIVTCSQDCFVRVYSADSGNLLTSFEKFKEPVGACVWAADSRSFIVGSLDLRRSLVTVYVDGRGYSDWNKEHRVEDLCGSSDGKWLVALDDCSKIYVYNAETRDLLWDMKFRVRPTSVCISSDSKYLLVNKKDGEAQLFDLVTRECVQKFLGHTGGDFIIRSAFGGANESFVVSGSEDGNVLIWHKTIGAAVERLGAHDARCNSISWCSTDPTILASCGDDGKIKMYVHDLEEPEGEREGERIQRESDVVLTCKLDGPAKRGP